MINIEHILDRLSTENEEDIIFSIIHAASEIWEEAGCPADFCVQHVDMTGIVFGSTNRVAWNPLGGFRMDYSYCTDNFIKSFEEMFGIENE